MLLLFRLRFIVANQIKIEMQIKLIMRYASTQKENIVILLPYMEYLISILKQNKSSTKYKQSKLNMNQSIQQFKKKQWWNLIEIDYGD